MAQREDEKIALLRIAIRELRQVVCGGKGLPREFCPHILGTKERVWRTLVWQFDGSSERGGLPSWRGFDLHDLEQITLRDGEWHRGWETGRRKQHLIDVIDTVVGPAHAAEIRETSPPRIPPLVPARRGLRR
jgi:hypothetical protein